MTENRHLTLRERIHDEVVRMILEGELPAGSQIDERALIAKLNASRTPFREAIGSLAKEGLVEIQPYRGFTVRAFSPKEVGDLYALRRVLESFAIRLAVAHISNAHIAQLEDLLNASVAALESGDMTAYGQHDRSFHELIANLSDNDAVITALSRLSLQIQMCRVIANQSPDLAARAARERDQILDALRRRDADRASELMDAHIADVQQAVMAHLQQQAPANDLNPGVGTTRRRRP
jgi:DNA-binding GntR family transcriptional regulator